MLGTCACYCSCRFKAAHGAARYLAALLLLFVAWGCGGSQNNGGAVQQANLILTIQWPARQPALIPNSSQSISIVVSVGSKTLAHQEAKRPTGAQTQTTASFAGIPVGSVTIAASAFASTDGSGTAQATGQTTVQVTSDSVAQVGISMVSTVATLALSPNPLTVIKGAAVSLTATAYDSQNRIVLTSSTAGQDLTWVSASTAIATVGGSGSTVQVTGVAFGSTSVTATIKVNDAGQTVSDSVPVTVSSGSSSKKYTITDLGVPAGYNTSGATGINASGVVCGSSGQSGQSGQNAPAGAAIFQNGQATTVPVSAALNAEAINASGQVLCNQPVYAGGSLLYTGGNISYLPSTATTGQKGTCFTYGLNASGTVVGTFSGVGFTWAPGASSVTLVPSSFEISAINDAGLMCGTTGVPMRGADAVLFSADGTATHLGANGGYGSVAVAINSKGQLAGTIQPTSSVGHAMFYDGSKMIDLGALPGDTGSQAYALNSSGAVVGFSLLTSPGVQTYRAFVYSASTGMNDLATLVDSSGKGWTFSIATGINDSGAICGDGINPQGQYRAFLAVPSH